VLSSVWLEAVDGERGLSFTATNIEALPGLDFSSFRVALREELGPVKILKQDHGRAPVEGAFTYDDRLTSADVIAPTPFAGAAAYRTTPDGTTTWTGDLSAELPGADRFSLTGPTFRVRLYRRSEL
jgi:hypothetical protein